MNYPEIIYARKDKGNRTGYKHIPAVKSNTLICCKCHMTIGHAEKRTKTTDGDAHDDCLRKIIVKTLRETAKMPNLQTGVSPKAVLEEGLATIFWNFELDKQFNAKKLEQLRSLHQDFFGMPLQTSRLSTTRRITRAIFNMLPGESKEKFRKRVDKDLQLVEERWEKIFGQEFRLSILNESMM